MTAVTTKGMFLLTDRQCFSILAWAAAQPQNGLVSRAFLASIALAALQPEEALTLRVRDVELDDDGRGVLLIPSQGRELRAEEVDGAATVRMVPVGRDLAAILKEEFARRGLAPEDLVFVLDDGRPLTAPVYRNVWQRARAAVPEPHEADSPLGRTVSALRDACRAAWLRNGDQAAAHVVAVAECVSVSAPRLAERFAHCLRKPAPAEIPWHLMEAAMDLPGSPSGPRGAVLRS